HHPLSSTPFYQAGSEDNRPTLACDQRDASRKIKKGLRGRGDSAGGVVASIQIDFTRKELQMNWKRVSLVMALALGVAGVSARAQSLGIGDPAPKLEVKSFVKGEPVKEFEPGKNYVVEFWATWCGPCKATIPHLTELQKKHPEVAFIGVSIWEEDQSGVK